MTESKINEFNKIRIGDCKKGTCCKLEDLQICSVKDPEHDFVQEPYNSFFKKEGYEDVKKIPRNLRLSLFQKANSIRKERLIAWKQSQLEKLGICPNH